MTIVYKSNTGFTQEYAQMLAKAQKLKLMTLDEALEKLPPEEEVLFMGPLMAGHITGLDKAMKRWNIIATCGVGMMAFTEQLKSDMIRSNYLKEGTPLFYFRGGWAPSKVSWIKRRMVNMSIKALRQPLDAKGSRRTPAEQAELDMYTKGGSFVAYQNLKVLEDWLEQRKA